MKKVKKRIPGLTTISGKNHITIPVNALRAAGLAPGDRLRVSASRDGRITLEQQVDPVQSHAGALTGRLDRSLIESLRDEWD